MTKHAHIKILILCSMVIFSACSRFNCTRFENYIGSDTDLISYSYNIADDLIDSAMPPLMPRHPDMPVLITTFVDNNNLENTSRFGRTVQEHMSSRFVQRGFTVKELKLTNRILIEERSGETMLSRDLAELTGTASGQAVVVGTWSLTNRTMYISARMINPVDKNVIGSVDYNLCMDDTLLAMFGLKRGTGEKSIQQPSESRLNNILY